MVDRATSDDGKVINENPALIGIRMSEDSDMDGFASEVCQWNLRVLPSIVLGDVLVAEKKVLPEYRSVASLAGYEDGEFFCIHAERRGRAIGELERRGTFNSDSRCNEPVVGGVIPVGFAIGGYGIVCSGPRAGMPSTVVVVPVHDLPADRDVLISPIFKVTGVRQ